MTRLIALATLGLGLLGNGCTFYTSCPTGGDATPPPGNTGGSMSGPPPAGTGEELDVPGEWQDSTGSLEGLESECGNVLNLVGNPGNGSVIAGVVTNGLWETADGAEWRPLGTAEGSAKIINTASSIVFDPESPEVFWEAGLYYGPGVYRTDDAGETFVQLGDLTHNATVSVDFTDPERKTLLLAGHERANVLFLSTDGGTEWQPIGDAIPPDTIYCDFPHILDTQTFLLGCAGYGDEQNGIFRSEDAGQSWTLVSEAGGYREPLVASDGTIYWATLLVGHMVKSTDQGQTWQTVGAGPYLARPLELPDGRIVAMSQHRMLISDDNGEVWHPFGPDYPENVEPEFFAYSTAERAFYAARGTCDEAVKAGTIQRFAFDFEEY